jgi:hypothetical protein
MRVAWRPLRALPNKALEWLEVKCHFAIGAIAAVYKNAGAAIGQINEKMRAAPIAIYESVKPMR